MITWTSWYFVQISIWHSVAGKRLGCRFDPWCVPWSLHQKCSPPLFEVGKTSPLQKRAMASEDNDNHMVKVTGHFDITETMLG